MLRPFPFLKRTLKKSSSLQQNVPALPDLILAAGKLALILQSGRHGQRRHGPGEDFWQFRPYNAHEPASLIDWKQSARSPDDWVLWVKEREKQTPRPLSLWVDPSASMKWRSSKKLPLKYDSAVISALALGKASLHAGESVSISGQKRFLTGTQFLPKLALDISRIHQDFPNFRTVPAHATLILFSDFLWNDALLEKLAIECRNRPGKTVLFRILDPAEYSLPYKGLFKFTSEENEPSLDLTIDEEAQKQYQSHMHRQSEILVHISQTIPSVFCHFHHNERPLLPSLLTVRALVGDKA